MEQDFEKIIESLESRLHQEGLGIKRVGCTLFTPEEALIFLDEVISLNLDLAILATVLWDRNKDGDYYESPDIYGFYKVKRDDKLVEYSYRETKKYLESWVGDPTIDRLVIHFESNKYRQKRLEQLKKTRND
jgi:hypothetical protein